MLFKRRRHKPEVLFEILGEAVRQILDELPEYVDALRPEPIERARSEVSMVLFVVSVANACVETSGDRRMKEAFEEACRRLFASMPGGEALIEWDYYVVDNREMRLVEEVCREMGQYGPPTRGDITFHAVARTLSRVRNREYAEDVRATMELSARVKEQPQEVMARVFRALGEAFTRRVQGPLATARDPYGERFREGSRVISRILGSAWFYINDRLRKI